MLDIRLHIVMGHAHASLWCSAHQPQHCIWKGTQQIDGEDLVLRVRTLAGAAAAAAVAVAEWAADGRHVCGPEV